MGNRLSKITTRTGDDGTTGLVDGSRVSKSSARIELIGQADELNCSIGLLLTYPLSTEIREILMTVQHHLFDLGGELATPGAETLSLAYPEMLEELIERYNSQLPPLKEFILPGGNRIAALCHVARTVCRKMERSLVGLGELETINPLSLKYLNRLSDLLFILSRVLCRSEGNAEVYWSQKYAIISNNS